MVRPSCSGFEQVPVVVSLLLYTYEQLLVLDMLICMYPKLTVTMFTDVFFNHNDGSRVMICLECQVCFFFQQASVLSFFLSVDKYEC
jgi:hypothetical protein